MVRFLAISLSLLTFFAIHPRIAAQSVPQATPASAAKQTPEPPPPAPLLNREFRGLWVATKANIDWPSRPGLPVAQQQAELRNLIDTAARFNLNAVIFQVRPQADAFYASAREPWSEYLTGREGVAPVPFWDPLQFAIQEAHQRGLELHAWVNPFRVKAETARSPMATNHFARYQPNMVRSYGQHLWLDPGEFDARAHSYAVIMDIVERYDIDSLHMDDYFYPYPIKDGRGNLIPFPDDSSWETHGRTAGFNNRGDWRRANIDRFVQDVHLGIQEAKPWVKFGVSPFGIWRPGHPPSVRGLDAYDVLAADARKWLQNGWVDYLAPQLYWNIQAPQQSFPELLDWWVSQNIESRHIWPGISAARIGQDRNATEIARQIDVVRHQTGSTGYLVWSANALMGNKGGVTALLGQNNWKEPAIVPPSPWLGTNTPALADFLAGPVPGRPDIQIQWRLNDTNSVARFALQTRFKREWKLEVLPATASHRVFSRRPNQELPDEVRLTPIGRTGLEGNSGIWRRP